MLLLGWSISTSNSKLSFADVSKSDLNISLPIFLSLQKGTQRKKHMQLSEFPPSLGVFVFTP